MSIQPRERRYASVLGKVRMAFKREMLSMPTSTTLRCRFRVSGKSSRCRRIDSRTLTAAWMFLKTCLCRFRVAHLTNVKSAVVVAVLFLKGMHFEMEIESSGFFRSVETRLMVE